MHPPTDLPRGVTGLWRIAYVLCGLAFVGLAVLGAVLPLLPTTPFLLLASYFFVRSSPRLHAWLLRSRLFGGFLRDWQRHRGVRPHVKVAALTMLPLVVCTSVTLGNLAWYLVAALLVLAAVGVIVVVRLPVIREEVPAAQAAD